MSFYKVQLSTEQVFSLDHVGLGIYRAEHLMLLFMWFKFSYQLIMDMFPAKWE